MSRSAGECPTVSRLEVDGLLPVLPPTPDVRSVVACVLLHAGRVCLLRRSRSVGSDQARWHCVTGFLPDAVDPLAQALSEIAEETGIQPEAVRLVRRAPPFELIAVDGPWTVHPFLFAVDSSTICLNWENDAYRWADPGALGGEATVPWLFDICLALDVRRLTLAGGASSTLRTRPE